MKYSLSDTPVRNIGDNLKIYDLFCNPKANMDFVIAELNGDHPMIINRVSDRVYFVFDGQGEVFVDNEWVPVKPCDCVYIEKGMRHSIRGKLKYAIITAPPFAVENEMEL